MNILLVDDHIMTLQGYETFIGKLGAQVSKALTCKDVYDLVLAGTIFDVAIIDYNIPLYPAQELYSGADCAVFIKKYMPKCKIVLVTAHTEVIDLYTMYKKAQPNALIVKGDFNVAKFKAIVHSKEKKDTYLSPRAQEAITLGKMKVELLTDTNVEILMYLSKGYKINELTDIIELSKSAIQKRIAKMQAEFNVTDTQSLVKIMYELDYF